MRFFYVPGGVTLKTIAFLNQKGGVGKTMLSTNIACYMAKVSGLKTLLVDTDQQGTSRDWFSHGKRNDMDCIAMDRAQQLRSLNSFSQYDLSIIDGAPGLTETTTQTIKIADLIIIPVQPSPYDIWATSDLVDLIEMSMPLRPRLKAYFLLQRKIPNTNISKDAFSILKKHELINTLEVGTHQRVAYQEAAALGKSVIETNTNQQAVNEILTIGTTIKQLMEDL